MTDNCCGTISHSKIKFEENRSSIVFRNPDNHEFERCEVDGCLITTGIRCDKLLRRPNVCVLFIELKGTDLEHAKNQLATTISSPQLRSRREPHAAAIVVCSKVRIPAASSFILRAKQEFAKQFKARFIVKSSPAEFCPYEASGAA